MKIMACLISGQHVPNLLAIQTVKPDWLYLVVTPRMAGKESQLLNALVVGGLDYRSKHKIIDLKEENSIDGINEGLKNVFDNHPRDEWIVNLTGGTKPMSIGAYEFSKNRGLKTLYIAEGNQREAIDLLGGPSVPINHNLSTAEFLAGYGFDVLNSGSLAKSEERARSLIDIASFLAKHNEDPDLRGFLGRLQSFKEAKIKLDKKDWEKNGFVLAEEDNVFLNDEVLRTQIATKFGLGTVGPKLTGKLDRPTAEFLTGKWLEVFVWSLLLPFIDKGIWDLHLGVSAGGKGAGENNDLDISFMRNQSLCIVECKTGGQEHDPEADGVLYKIEAVKSGPKALRVETYLATTSDNIKDQAKRGIKEKLLRRSKIYGCNIIPGWRIKEMAELNRSNDPRLRLEVADAFGLKSGA